MVVGIGGGRDFVDGVCVLRGSPPRPSLSLVRRPPASLAGQIPHGASDLSECGVLLQIAQEMELLDGVEELEQSFGDSLGSRRSFAAPDVTSQ